MSAEPALLVDVRFDGDEPASTEVFKKLLGVITE